MKMNIGIDTSTGSTATPPHMRSRMFDRLTIGKTPSSSRCTAKISAGAAQHERDRIAAEDDEEHRHEHDQREIVGRTSRSCARYTSSSAWPICRSTSLCGAAAEQEHDQRAA